jgi:D-lactate dehydrogenase
VEKIRKKYRIKNTTGYGMNALLDFEDPVDMVLHLMVGSEGTLGFVSEATFRTVPVKPHRASSLIYFSDLESACQAVPLLREARKSPPLRSWTGRPCARWRIMTGSRATSGSWTRE